MAFFPGYGYYDADDYDADGYGGYGGLWSGFAEKSKHAREREDQAKAAFDKLAAQVKPGSSKSVHHLLDPSVHLTGPCFRDFKKHVKAHPGWNAKQRRASVEDKAKYRPTGRGHASWIDVVYTPPATSSQSASSGSAINKKVKKAASSKGSKK